MTHESSHPKKKITSNRPEVEFSGPIWKHPYFLYVWLTAILFALMIGVAWLAIDQGWVATRTT